MSEIRIASRYAKSLIELANEQKSVEAVHADMELLSATCKASKELVIMLKSPIIHGDKKRQVLENSFTDFNKLTRLFVETVIRKGREAYLPLIAKEAIRMYNEEHNIASATVTTASPMDAKMMGEIRKTLEQKTGKKIVLESEVDPNLIGGLVVRLGDSLFDASISKQLKNIKKELVLN
ncbi:MAG: ATP synthase F1 subunit delta [Bacteroidetes bacterium]|nr:ATP synthase F1 subunit delta [Bacteroidota bacterium]